MSNAGPVELFGMPLPDKQGVDNEGRRSLVWASRKKEKHAARLKPPRDPLRGILTAMEWELTVFEQGVPVQRVTGSRELVVAIMLRAWMKENL